MMVRAKSVASLDELLQLAKKQGSDRIIVGPACRVVRVEDERKRVAGMVVKVEYLILYATYNTRRRQRTICYSESYFEATRSQLGFTHGSSSYDRDDLIMILTAHERIQELHRDHREFGYDLCLDDAPATAAELDPLLAQAADLNLRPLPRP